MVIRKDILTREHGLNARQSAVLDFLINNAHMHIRDFEQLCPDVNRRTLQRDLNRLEELALIRKKGAARQSLYSLNKKAL
jgi:DNA-binding HxlR family transcriptional regulator